MSPREGRSVSNLLNDIEGAIADLKKAETLSDSSAEGSEIYRVAFNAILYDPVVIGEAVNALPEEVKAKEQEIPWRRIVDMRNLLTDFPHV